MKEPPCHVLVVHPDPRIFDRVAAIVRPLGCDVLHARSGEQAVDLFVQRPADIVVVGLALPGRDGARTVETIRWAPGGREARIVLLTGRSSSHRLETAVRRIAPLATISGDPPDLWDLGDALRRALRPEPPSVSSCPPPPDPTVVAPPAETTIEARQQVDPTLEHAPPPPDTGGSGLQESRWVAARCERLQEAAQLHGDLEETPFPLVLARLAELRASGELVVDAVHDPRATLDGGPVRKVVIFRTGVPVGVHSNLLEERLGRILLRRGRIDPAGLERSLEEARRQGRAHGETLVAMGLLDHEELRSLLASQFEERLFDLFSWRAGTFRFAEGPVPRGAAAPLEMSLPEILLRGVTGHLDARLALTRMRSWLDGEVHLDPAVLERFERAGADLSEQAFGARLEERPILRSLVSGSAERALLLYALWCGGAVHFREPGNEGTPPAPSEPAPSAPSERTAEHAPGARRRPSAAPAPAAPPAPRLEDTRRADPEHMGIDAALERTLRAEQFFRQGIHAMERGETERGLEAIETAARLCPHEGEFLAWRAYGRYLRDRANPTSRKRALDEAREARAMAPEHASVHLLHARMLLAEGKLEAAREAFEATLRVAPKHQEAREALSELDATR